MADRNPYVIGVPLTGDATFYGRQEIFTFIKDVLDAEKQNVIVLYGQRRIGKTSVLHRAGKWLEGQGSFSPVYFDLQGKERLSLGQVLENLAHTVARRLGLAIPDSAIFDEEGRYFSDRFLPQAFTCLGENRLVLLFDEFDVLGDELESPGAASETLFPYLQDLIVNQPRIGFVFVVGRRIEELATHFQAIFKQAVYRRVGHLKPEDSRELIVAPSRTMISYSDDAIEEIQNLAAGHPYFTQLICFEAFNAQKGNGQPRVTRDVICNVVNRAIESGHGALNWFWEGLPRAERFILSAVAGASDGSGIGSKEDVRHLLEEHRILLSGLELKDAPDRLVEWEMLRRAGPDAYQFVVELVRRWVVQEHPLSSARRDIDYVNKRAVRLFENAREAHSEGDLAYARDEYRRTLKANPNHSGAQLGLALVLYELGEIDEAIVEFERAYAIDEMSARDGLIRARLAKAKTLEEGNLTDNAVLEYEKVHQLAVGEETAVRRLSSIWKTRADAALAVRDLASCRAAFREVLKLDKRQEARAHIQTVLLAHAEKSEAAGHLKEAAASYYLLFDLLPDRKDDVKVRALTFWVHFGESLERNGLLDRAITIYTTALKVFPAESVMAERLESVKLKSEQLQAVDDVFERALAAHRSGNIDEARAGWKKLIALDVFSYKGHNIATLLSRTIDAQKELSSVQRKDVTTVDDEPSIPTAWTSHGKPLFPSGSPPEAEKSRDPEPDERIRVVETELAGHVQPGILPENSLLEKDRDSSLFTPARIASLGIFLALCLVAFLSVPASLVGIDMDPVEVRPGKTVSLDLAPRYSSTWRRTGKYLYRSDYYWESSDSSVATVSDGDVHAVRPGAVRITARHGDVIGSTDVSVPPWDVPPFNASFKQILFFAGDGESIPRLGDRSYQTRFDSKTTRAIFTELVLTVTEALTGEGKAETVISYMLYRRDGSLVKDSMSKVNLPKSWPMADATWTLRLNFGSGFTPDTYRVTYKHDGKVIGTAEFVVE